MNKVYCSECENYCYGSRVMGHENFCGIGIYKETHRSKETFIGWSDPEKKNKNNDCKDFTKIKTFWQRIFG